MEGAEDMELRRDPDTKGYKVWEKAPDSPAQNSEVNTGVSEAGERMAWLVVTGLCRLCFLLCGGIFWKYIWL